MATSVVRSCSRLLRRPTSGAWSQASTSGARAESDRPQIGRAPDRSAGPGRPRPDHALRPAFAAAGAVSNTGDSPATSEGAPLNSGEAGDGPVFSVCIVTAGRPTLRACLGSILAAASAVPVDVQILVAENGCEPQSYPSPAIETITFDDRARLGSARNELVRHSDADTIVFLDDDIEVPPQYFAMLQRLCSRHPEVAIFGGPNLGIRSATPIEVAQSIALSSRLVAGPFSYRYRLERQRWDSAASVTLCNLAVRRSRFVEFSDLVDDAGEETLLLKAVMADGGRVLADPVLHVHHHRRPSLRSFFEQASKYGRGRATAARIAGDPSRGRLIIAAGLIFVVGGWMNPRRVGAALAAHLVVVLSAVARPVRRHRQATSLTQAVLASYTLQAGYGMGLMHGIRPIRRASASAHGARGDEQELNVRS